MSLRIKMRCFFVIVFKKFESVEKCCNFWKFLHNFLHLLLNRCDLKLNPVMIYGSVFTSLQHFLVVVIIFPWLLTPTPVKNGESYSFAIAITWIWRVFHNLSSDEWYREPTPTSGIHCPQRLLSCSCYETQLRIVRVR